MEKLIREIFKKENLAIGRIKKATSGFTNVVYFVDDKVIKISNDERTKDKLKKEISIYSHIKLDKMPQYIASGELEGSVYLIISKLNGQGLYSIWHKLSCKEREDCIKQIASTLKLFHQQSAEFLPDDCKILDWKNDVEKKLKENKIALENLGVSTKKVEQMLSELDVFNENDFCLVYNDAHFDNFIVCEGKVMLIDFDRAMYAPIDYELLIFKTMCDNPQKFASEEDEPNVFDEDFKNVYENFKKYYPEIFKTKNLEKRLLIYQFNYLCSNALKIKDAKEKMGSIAQILKI